MLKFKLTAPAFIQNAYREEGTVVALNCSVHDGKEKLAAGTPTVTLSDGVVYVGKELPPRSAVRAADSEAAAKPAPLPKEPKPNP